MNTSDIALARHHSYRLFSRLYLEGVTAVTHPTIQHIPQLAETLPDPFDADEAAADQQALFGFNVFPYESIFLDDSGLLGGSISDVVLHSYQAAGFQVKADSTSPDHVGHELELLAHLCGAEADAWEDDLPAAAGRIRHLQRDFLQNHLLRWLLPFVLAVGEQKRPFYTSLAQLTLDLIYNHWQEITTTDGYCVLRIAYPPKINTQYTIRNTLSQNFPPEPPSLLDDDKTGLKEIAHYLTTPAYSGFFLSRDDIARLARTQNIPRGFGDRAQMLTNLLRGAAQFNVLSALLDELQGLIVFWQETYTTGIGKMPALAPFAATWQERITNTSQMLTKIERQVEMTA